MRQVPFSRQGKTASATAGAPSATGTSNSTTAAPQGVAVDAPLLLRRTAVVANLLALNGRNIFAANCSPTPI